MDTVTLRAGATLGPHSVILPAAVLGKHATVGPVSLVMRGESVPDKTRWIGNPIGPWVDDGARERGRPMSRRPPERPTTTSRARRPLLRRPALRPATSLPGRRQPPRRPGRAARGRPHRRRRASPRPAPAHGLQGAPSTSSGRRSSRSRRGKLVVRTRAGHRGGRGVPPSPSATAARPRPISDGRSATRAGRSSPTASSSPARPTAPRPGSPATTGRPTRRATASRSPPHRRTTCVANGA